MTAQRRLEKELRRCLLVLISRYQPERILLFGSLAEGSVHPYSDIDLIIIKQTTQSFWERILDVHHLLQPELPIHLFVYTPEEWQELQGRLFFREEVLKKGKVLYDASGSGEMVSLR
ncbi:hypothetical protein HRbin16_01711 [bacterium HR16]|nr:hypothetical protein HRbin16_01711 [bacterium HR16]